jgi:hypothetical protein
MTAAESIARIRELLPTSLGSQQIRDAIAADLRARSVFSAQVANVTFLDAIKKLVDELAAGTTDAATARWALAETLKELGYTPEEGFPDVPPGDVPPAVAGTLQDLRSPRRLNLIVRTQTDLVRGRGQQLRGTEARRLSLFPAWELVRAMSRRMPRAWGGADEGSLPRRGKRVDPRPRWIIAGGRVLPGGRLIAFKGDPVWGELGSSGNFDDALDVDYPPFAFNSGMRWVEVSRAECKRLGVRGPNGETIEQWLSQEHPTLVDTQSGIPAPQASLKSIDPAVRRAFERSAGITLVEDIATTSGNAEEIRRRIAERRAARESARQADMRAAIEKGVKP